MTPTEIAEQVEGYSSLGVTKSYRKISALLLLLSVALTTLIGTSLLKLTWSGIATSDVVYASLAIFCFRGHRWAFVLSMILWTFEKGAGLASLSSIGGSGIVIGSVIWWGLYTGTFWKALIVERERRRMPAPMGITVQGAG